MNSMLQGHLPQCIGKHAVAMVRTVLARVVNAKAPGLWTYAISMSASYTYTNSGAVAGERLQGKLGTKRVLTYQHTVLPPRRTAPARKPHAQDCSWSTSTQTRGTRQIVKNPNGIGRTRSESCTQLVHCHIRDTAPGALGLG